MQTPADRSDVSADPDGEFPFAVADTLFIYMMHVLRFRDSAQRAVLAPLGLGPSRHRILFVLARMGPTAMSDVSAQTGIDRTTLTRVADRLVKDGLVERTDAPGDRRRVRLVLTGKGRATYRQALKVAADLNRSVAAALSEGAQREMTRMLRTLVAALTPDPELREQLIKVRPQTPRPSAAKRAS